MAENLKMMSSAHRELPSVIKNCQQHLKEKQVIFAVTPAACFCIHRQAIRVLAPLSSTFLSSYQHALSPTIQGRGRLVSCNSVFTCFVDRL